MKSSSIRLGDFALSVLPPTGASIPSEFNAVVAAPAEREELLSEVQRFRGQVYLADGALPSSALDHLGRHRVSCDYDSWHIVVANRNRVVSGCIRLRYFPTQFEIGNLHLFQVINRMPTSIRRRHIQAIESLKQEASLSRMMFAEVGGWAITEELRNGSAGVTLALASWPLTRLLGGAVGAAAATMRHQSAKILARIGGGGTIDPETQLEPFYDDIFRCEMQILAFDSRRLAPQYERWAESIQEHLAVAPILVESLC